MAASLHLPSTQKTAEPPPIVVCCHGLTGTRIGTCYRFVRLARRLVERNIACLRFDFRGCGESDGRFRDMRVESLTEDLRAAIATLDDLPQVQATRLGIVASSFGAYTTALVSESLASLSCVVMWAPVADAGSLIDRDMTEEGRVFLNAHGWVEHHGLRLGRVFVDQIPDADAPALLAKNPKPLLVFHGNGDRLVPVDHGRAYVSAIAEAGGEARLEALPVDDHGMRTVAANDAIIEGSVDWFCRFLQPAPVSESTA